MSIHMKPTLGKEMRRKFQLMTRCMTAMIERIMEPINTTDCWKIMFECVNDCSDNKYKNLLGVYVIQVQLNVVNFFQQSDYDKKKIVVDKISEGIYMVFADKNNIILKEV